MKILIIGEFSGFAKHLKNGFQILGHDVTIVQSGDGWKKLCANEDIMCRNQTWSFFGRPISGTNRIRAVFTNIRVQQQLKEKCPLPELIIVVNFSFISKSLFDAGVSRRYIQNCVKRGAKLIMSECGESCAESYYYTKVNKSDVYLRIGAKTPPKDCRYSFLLKYSNAIIPTTYGYYKPLLAYAAYEPYDTAKLTKAIPLPITVDKAVNISTCKDRKVVVFHGVIRPIAKGTPYIQEAMKKLQEEMPEDVECVCLGGLPYDEYIKLFERIDILIDQTYGNGWGINAIIGAMKGKCVLTSTGPENCENMGIPNIPFVQIEPDSNQIYQVLKALVLDRKRIDDIKIASRHFAENYCESSIIAKRYIEVVNL